MGRRGEAGCGRRRSAVGALEYRAMLTQAVLESTEVSGALGEKLGVLGELIGRGGVLVLSGAGVSTGSGIPDYRDQSGQWKHRQPIQFRDFVGHEATRKRYWARSFIGWPRMAAAQPNPAHRALAALERRGLVQLLVTQNVDGLHQKSGSSNVVDLHGRLDQVVCLSCARALPRSELQQSLSALNPDWHGAPAESTPDGDADLGDRDTSRFRVVDCEACGGLLKPDVVFFGEHVPAPRVERSMAALDEARSLLVIGSSLMVFSGFRFPRAARKLGLPIAVLNRGRTRADDFAAVKVDAEAGAALQHVLEALTPDAVVGVGLGSSRG